MGSRRTSHLAGIALPIDPDRLLDALEPVDGTATGSSYTQAGPRPGASVPEDDASHLVPVVSGGLGVDLETVVLRQGPAELSELACELGWRLAGEAGSLIRGWIAPNWITGSWLVLGAAVEQAPSAVVTVPSTQLVVGAFAYSNAVYIRTYQPGGDGTWSAAASVHAAQASTIAMAVGPDEELFLLIEGSGTAQNPLYSSLDGGTTWTYRGRHSVGGSSSDAMSMAWTPAGWVIFHQDGTTLRQYASAGDPSSARLVVTSTTIAQAGSSCAALPNGSVVLAYKKQSGLYPTVRILASPWQPVGDAVEVVLEAVVCSEIAIAADADGLLWAWVTNGSTPGQAVVWFSTDGGYTWSSFAGYSWDLCSSAADYLQNLRPTVAAGAVYLLAQPVGSTSGANQTLAVRLGGWSNVTPRDADGGLAYRLYPSLASYLPFEEPDNTGQWTKTSAGTPTISLLNTGLYLYTDPGGTDLVYYTRTLGGQLYRTAEIMVRVVSGGSSTADEIYLVLRAADGASDYRVKLRLYVSGGTTWCNTRDPNAGAPSKSTDDLGVAAGDPVRFLVHIEADTGYVWWANPNDTTWTLLWSGALTSAGSPAAAGQIEWGCGVTPASTIAEVAWAYLECGGIAANYLGAGVMSLTNAGAAGRMVAQPIALHPELADTAGLVPWLSVASGPGRLGEVHDIDRAYDYPVEALLPTVSPSPATRWRSTQTVVDEVIAWDFEQESWIGDSLALVAIGTNFRTATLDYYNGAAWVTSATLDLATGFDGVDYSLAGDCLTPGAATASGARYLQEGELAGGFVILSVDGGGGTTARRIRWNTAGSWIAAGQGTPRTRILLDGDMTDIDATGSCTIVWPAGVVVVHLPALLRVRRWRVVIDGGQDCPDDHYRAGVLVPLAIRAWGAPPDWGWSQERIPNAEGRTSRYGTTRVQQLGPLLGGWTFGWATSGTDVFDLRNTEAPDYLGASGGLPLIAAEDVGWLLGGLLELLESGAVPCVVFAEIPDTSGTTLTDPTLWVYGLLEGSARLEHVNGTEGDDEFLRVAQITVRRLV